MAVTGISEITGFPECLTYRVKTLHPMVHAGILAMRGNPDHMRQVEELGVTLIDVVAINLYPFKQTILKPDVTFEDAIENIDIGGPTMIRAAAKTGRMWRSSVDPADYGAVIEELKTGAVSRETKFRLAAKVFETTAAYDALISGYLRKQMGAGPFPEKFTVTMRRFRICATARTPHQAAAFHKEILRGTTSWQRPPAPRQGALLQQHQRRQRRSGHPQGVRLRAALRSGGKTRQPCGVGVGATLHEAYLKAYEADPVSIFGGHCRPQPGGGQGDCRGALQDLPGDYPGPSFSAEALAILEKKRTSASWSCPACTKPTAVTCWI